MARLSGKDICHADAICGFDHLLTTHTPYGYIFLRKSDSLSHQGVMRAVFAVILSIVMLAVNGSYCSPGDGHHAHAGKAMAAHVGDMAPYGSCDPLSGLCDLTGQAPSLDPITVTASAPTTQPFIPGHPASVYWTDLHQQADMATPSLPVKATIFSFSTPVTRHTVLRI